VVGGGFNKKNLISFFIVTKITQFTMNPQYIMTPQMFKGLCCLRGFNELNGKNYQEHICIIMEDKLDNNQKNKIHECQTEEEALKYLSTIIDFTHNTDFP